MGVDAKTDMKDVAVSEAAARKIAALLAGEPDKIALRVAVERGGCSVFSYIID
ncbi:MAG TPA: iron-sulfur cluster assembly accessory protein, partial [Aquamicrobium sp.]|nr:iron-sulfur cluster assembly accessory protein [Aquamicrobium sp.]